MRVEKGMWNIPAHNATPAGLADANHAGLHSFADGECGIWNLEYRI